MTKTPETTVADVKLTEAVNALGRLLDGDAHYDGGEIHIVCDSHSDAIARMRLGRAALDSLRTLLAARSAPPVEG